MNSFKTETVGLAAIAFCLLVMCGAAFWRIGAARQTMAQQRKIPIYCVETTEPRIAISFDVATGTEDLQQLLDILERHQVHATFFMVGSWIRKWPDEVRKIYEAGHELANHADHHVDMAAISVEEGIKEIQGAQKEIYNLTGCTTDLFRPPYGSYNNGVIEAAEQCGYETVQWSVDSLDWKEYGAEDMLRRVLEHEKLKPGAILLFHNNTKYTAQALDGILTGLEAKGYTIGTVSELILKENYTIDSEGCQHSIS